ncbi:hypothetical protein [Chryseolinea lacunae]|uniref:Phosphatidate cytidylyltransferase n=1 Tax=Chryseolinea lacunae TaxID=2801331 RepID=A0ABS1KZ74_9BACT|nr:hypothetical protein [Chryseolinea lacunae]MBL0744729.1 hypothetical protein [Chryseolinea lacunae]
MILKIIVFIGLLFVFACIAILIEARFGLAIGFAFTMLLVPITVKLIRARL